MTSYHLRFIHSFESGSATNPRHRIPHTCTGGHGVRQRQRDLVEVLASKREREREAAAATVLVSGPRSRGFRAYTCLSARCASRSRLWESPAYCRGWLDPSVGGGGNDAYTKRILSLCFVNMYVCVCCWFMPTVIGMNHGVFARERENGRGGAERMLCWVLLLLLLFIGGVWENERGWGVRVFAKVFGKKNVDEAKLGFVSMGVDYKVEYSPQPFCEVFSTSTND